jgi:uncharacterized membrane protein
MKRTTKGALIAGAVATLFATGAFAGDEAKAGAGEVKCSGVNACKGKGACKGADNACKGQNGCKGKGIAMMKSDKDCTKKHGTVVSEK